MPCSEKSRKAVDQEKEVTGCLKSSGESGKQDAIGGHAVKTKTTSTALQSDTGDIINELITAMT